MQQPQDTAGEQGGENRQAQAHTDRLQRRVNPRLAERHVGHEAGEGRCQHHALDADVDDARPLAHDAAQGCQHDGNGPQQRGLDHAGDVHGFITRCPGEESEHKKPHYRAQHRVVIAETLCQLPGAKESSHGSEDE
ncbi:MAG: hypothetical protein BWY63_02516 [Chloroflexi bacterium ADurb.Bin360]|nr:MAG: hypothetical protein BWY63_02516 [Chloroflexi bacterium ADurb.Bin360]